MMYTLEYLPIALEDMKEIVRYISHELENPVAAQRLSSKMVEMADKLKEFPYMNSVHAMIRPLKHEYRKLIVKNYIMFYRICEEKKLIIITRVIYSGRSYEELI